MADDAPDQDQKTELPTEKRLHEAAEKGQFAKSSELTVVLVLGSAVGALALTASSGAEMVAQFSVGTFTTFARTPVSIDSVSSTFADIALLTGRVLAPMLVACVGAAMLAGGLQSGFQFSPKAISFRPEALNPITGFGRVFNKSALVRAGLDVLKVLAIGSALYLGARALLEDPLFNSPVEAAYLITFLNESSITLFSRLLFSLGLIAALSYAWEKYKNSRDMMMTREELKQERKNSEGDALMKGAMRRMARRLMQKQMLDAVATADVVVTNPTHYAVALKYERGRDQAPVVLAKGENQFARRIKALAAEHGVPMVENRPVARMLYALGAVGETIPPQLYQAVAEILAVVYRTNRYYFHQLRSRRLEGAV